MSPERGNIRRDTIGFGELPPGQGAQTTLAVRGGPGRVKVGSDMLTVTPVAFGPEETTLTVKVKDGMDGMVLLDALVLESATERVKVEVLARWCAPAPPHTPAVDSPRGVFVASDLAQQGLQRRLGLGWIGQVIPLDDEKVLVISELGAGLFDLSGEVAGGGWEALWEIDCPADCGALSPDGRWLALGRGNDILLWDLAEGREVRRLEGHERGVLSVAFSPDGRLLASGSNDGTVRLWRVGT